MSERQLALHNISQCKIKQTKKPQNMNKNEDKVQSKAVMLPIEIAYLPKMFV